jgi:hypothetical protein
MAPKRRKDDHRGLVWSAAKATIAFIFFGALSFVGTWGVGLNSSIAKLKEDVEVLKEKEAMTINLVYPQLLEQTKQLREEIHEMRRDMKQLRRY